MLYALRYQKTQTPNIASLINLLLANGVSREDAKVRLVSETLLFSCRGPFLSWSMFC